jgi:hypothetical protein
MGKSNIKELSTAISVALSKNDVVALHKAADDVVEAGYELEDINLSPSVFIAVANKLIATSWVPKFEWLEFDE